MSSRDEAGSPNRGGMASPQMPRSPERGGGHDTNDVNKMEQELNRLRRDRVEDLAVTAQLLGSWMSDQNYTIAEQLTITELLRSSVLVVYIQMNQMEGMERFVKEHPGAKVVVVDAQKPPAPSSPRKFDPNKS